MAKTLLWIYVIGNFIINGLAYSQGYERDSFSFASIWIAIAVLAICESIEKNN